MIPSLNRRQDAGLILVLGGAGISLLLDVSAKQTAGFALLGLAATWFIGSVGPRTLGVIFSSMAFCIGLYVAVSPIWNEHESVLTAAQEYDSSLGKIRGAIAKSVTLDFSRAQPIDTERQGKYRFDDHGNAVESGASASRPTFDEHGNAVTR